MISWSAGLLVFAVSAGVALLLMRPAIRAAAQFGLVDRPGRHKRHGREVPIVGGLVLFAALWVSMAVGLTGFGGQFADVARALPYVVAGALIILFLGLADDITPLSAWTKLLFEIAAGLVLYLGGLHIDPITIPFAGSQALGAWSWVLTVAWVVMLTNAINLIDGLDGLATGVSLVAALTMAVIAALYQAAPAVFLAAALLGFLAVFLAYNRYPARAFLGDSGALQIGYYFAVMSLLVPLKSYAAAALYLPLLALGVPLFETALSISRRLAAGRNVMKADRRHVFHYLALAGLSPRAIVAIFWSLSAVFGLFSLAMYFWDRRLVLGMLVLFMVVILTGFLIFMARTSRPGRRFGDKG